MKIKDIELKNNIFLAPMAGITDMVFRLLCKEQGCGFVYTEMVSARGLCHKDKKTFKLIELSSGELPAAIQIFGSEPESMAQAVMILNDTRASVIDINMGCPTPKIVKNGDGCALMKRSELVREIVSGVVKASQKPVTVKIRKGWDETSVNAVEIAGICEECGAAAVAVHGRTREQFYSGRADWDIIREVKRNVRIPVIGNGDIFCAEDAARMIEHTGCDAVMVARGAQGNPWIFAEINEYLEKGSTGIKPSARDRKMMILRHFNLLVEYKGEAVALKEIRKHIAWYVKGMKNASVIKRMAFSMTCRDEIYKLMDEVFQ